MMNNEEPKQVSSPQASPTQLHQESNMDNNNNEVSNNQNVESKESSGAQEHPNDASISNSNEDDLSKMTVKELKAELKKHGIDDPKLKLKKDLVERLSQELTENN